MRVDDIRAHGPQVARHSRGDDAEPMGERKSSKPTMASDGERLVPGFDREPGERSLARYVRRDDLDGVTSREEPPGDRLHDGLDPPEGRGITLGRLDHPHVNAPRLRRSRGSWSVPN